MGKSTRAHPASTWRVHALHRSARDGPERLTQAYRLLLAPPREEDIVPVGTTPVAVTEGGH